MQINVAQAVSLRLSPMRRASTLHKLTACATIKRLLISVEYREKQIRLFQNLKYTGYCHSFGLAQDMSERGSIELPVLSAAEGKNPSYTGKLDSSGQKAAPQNDKAAYRSYTYFFGIA